ncbi:MAG: DUF1028 domain-containing protein [Melioribacteraceae bacterium]|nr:DUF1028 domain-containing protein [Melioribacteraceae bacterium]
MKYILLVILLLSNILFAQSPIGKETLAHTYSIVARDENTGEMGVAVQSHWFSVGTLVSWGEAGVGVVATQSFINPAFGPEGLKIIKDGKSAKEALEILIKNDEGRDVRQLAILDKSGNTAAYTGSRCIPFAGHIEGVNYSVQANLMESETVWGAMEKAFLETKDLPLAERLLAALEAAQAEGGDIRGKQSAAILVVRSESTGKIWEDRLVDLRIDDHSNPIQEMKRLLKVHRAYEHMNKGDLEIEHGNIEEAIKEYSTAEEMFPENLEMKFWHAVTLANAGEMDEALKLFKIVFSKNKKWHTLTPRLIKPKLLTVSKLDLEKIINLIYN